MDKIGISIEATRTIIRRYDVTDDGIVLCGGGQATRDQLATLKAAIAAFEKLLVELADQNDILIN